MEPSLLTFVHLSDLHIGQDGPAEVDRDCDPREELITDCKRVVAELDGEVTGILISGDIAHSGDPEEYRRAREWIARLCEVLGIGEENVWIVPGNHDFNRAMSTELWQSACGQLRNCPLDEIDVYLRRYLASDDKDILLRPLGPYHEFAAAYGCLPKGPIQVWDEYFDLADGLRLRIVGLNTAILADGDEDPAGNGLVVGENAMQFLRGGEDTYELAIWHHPLAWLRDREMARQYLDSRAVIHLFGHEHNHCLRGTGANLSVSAGALHPRRGSTGWDPRYNVIEISPPGTEPADGLDVAVISRQWDSAQTRFAAEGGGFEIVRTSFRVGVDGAGEEGEPALPMAPAEAVNAPSESYEDGVEQPRGRVANRQRRLALRYARLPYVTRTFIAGSLGLVAENDGNQASFEQTRLVIERARQRGQLSELWEAVAAEPGEAEMGPNPYEEALR